MRQSTSQRDQYINQTFAKEDVHLSKVREALLRDGKSGINIDPYEGRLLGLCLQLVRAQRVVEIGTLYGYSTLWMAKFLPPEGKIISIEKSPEHHQQAQKLLESSPQWGQIELRCGAALSILPTLRETYDVVFIDADKSGYMDYLLWADEHVRPGGLIIGDNTLLFGHMIGEGRGEVSGETVETMRRFNEYLSDSKRYESVLIPTFEGMTLAMKK